MELLLLFFTHIILMLLSVVLLLIMTLHQWLLVSSIYLFILSWMLLSCHWSQSFLKIIMTLCNFVFETYRFQTLIITWSTKWSCFLLNPWWIVWICVTFKLALTLSELWLLLNWFTSVLTYGAVVIRAQHLWISILAGSSLSTQWM